VTAENLAKLDRYRAELLRQDVPSEIGEQWTGAALPCATLTLEGDGPVVGRYGGHPLLPVDAPDPPCPLVATLNCAALPEEVTGLPLPPDGRLLLFAFPDPDYAYDWTVMYVPEGAAVEERTNIPPEYLEDPHNRKTVAAYPKGDLRLSRDVSLPFYGSQVKATDQGWRDEKVGWNSYGNEIQRTLMEVRGHYPPGGVVQVGGHAMQEVMDVNPVHQAALQADETGDLGDWLLLADWVPDIEGSEGFYAHWAIRRQDLVARRFDRVAVDLFWNP
jgi:hypothetical protein